MGSGTARIEYRWLEGSLTFLQDERGIVTKNTFDAASRRMTKSQVDVDGTEPDLPSGWIVGGTAPHLNATSDFAYDALARPIQSLGPVHAAIVGGASVAVRKASWTVYHESASGNQIWSGQGFQTVSSGTFTLIDPAREKRHRRGLIPQLLALRRHFKKGVGPLSNQQGDSGGSG